MGRWVAGIAVVLCAAAPAFAGLVVFTEDFETNPFGRTGGWSRSADVRWTGGGRNNDYVMLGSRPGNNDSRLWRSFVAPVTGKYGVGFDYRFLGIDLNPRIDDKAFVQIGVGREPLADVFDAVSSADLTGGLFRYGSWQNIAVVPTVVSLKAGQEYWLSFRFKEAVGCWSPVTSLNIDNIRIEATQSPRINPIPEPLTVALLGQGVLLLRRRNRA